MRRAVLPVLAGLLLAGCSVGVEDDGEVTYEGGYSPLPASFDDCLVGRWTTVSQTDRVEVAGEQLVATDVQRELEFSADGVETVTYGEAPAVVTRDDGSVAGALVQTGTVRFLVTADGGTMTFGGLDGEVQRSLVVDGSTYDAVVSPSSDPVSYRCDATALVQESDGYSAEFRRE